MKPNQKNRYNGRYNNRNNRSMITRNTALESSGPAGKLHGTALQLFEKYQSAAKDALIQNDLIAAQTYLQYADHYIRLQNMAIANEQNMRATLYPAPQATNTGTRPAEGAEAAETALSESQPIDTALAEETSAETKGNQENLPEKKQTKSKKYDLSSVKSKENSYKNNEKQKAESDLSGQVSSDAMGDSEAAESPKTLEKKSFHKSKLTAPFSSDKRDVSVTTTEDSKSETDSVALEKTIKKTVIRRGRPRLKPATATTPSAPVSTE